MGIIVYFASVLFIIAAILLMKNGKNRFIGVAACITLLWVGVIYSLSLQDAYASQAASDKVTQIINEVLDKFNVEDIRRVTFEDVIRAAAHIYEFMVLGFLTYTSFRLYRPHKALMLSAVIFGIVVPVTDEVLQLFSDGRAFEVIDMVKDWFGFFAGLFIAMGVYSLLHRKNKRKLKA